MARYTDIDKLIAEYDRVHVGAPGGARKLMVEAPIADVAPRAEVALEVIEEVEKMARDYIDGIMLLDPQNTYCFGGINAFEHVIRFLAELKKKYTEVQK